MIKHPHRLVGYLSGVFLFVAVLTGCGRHTPGEIPYEKLNVVYSTEERLQYRQKTDGEKLVGLLFLDSDHETAEETEVSVTDVPPMFYYKKKPYTGKVVSYYPGKDKRVRFRGEMANGWEQGHWIAYYESGEKMAETEFGGGAIIHGFFVYDKTGDTLVKMLTGRLDNFERGGADDWLDYPGLIFNKGKESDPNDLLFMRSFPIVKDSATAEFARFYTYRADGFEVYMAGDTLFQKGLSFGMRKIVLGPNGVRREQFEYYSNGQLRMHGSFINTSSQQQEQPYNSEVHYYPNGKVKMEYDYTSGGDLLELKTYYENGQLNIHRSESKGIAKAFYSKGTPRLTGNYKDGEMEGTWKVFFSDGSLRSVRYFKRGDAFGRWICYSRPGVRYLEAEYTDGLLSAWRQFDVNGVMTFEDSGDEGGVNWKMLDEIDTLDARLWKLFE